MVTVHIPVLLHECINYLITDKSGVYVDCTLGTGGHFSEIARNTDKDAVLIGFDADPQAIEYCKQNLNIKQKTIYVNSNFEFLRKFCFRNGFPKVNGILMDLGMSSFALDNPERGIAFSKNGPLDMRFSPEIKMSAADFINNAEFESLRKVIWEYGEEKNSVRISNAIIKAREIKRISTTIELADVIKKITPSRFHNKTLSRVFQAIRIHINQELDILEDTLQQTLDTLSVGSRLVIITYHSLEDRIVKKFIKRETTSCLCPPEFPICTCNHVAKFKKLSKKIILPSKEEIKTNSRARSAKLRVVELIT